MEFKESGFEGPYSITDVSAVEFERIGVYALCRRNSTAYVGRSDSDVRGRLGKSISEGDGYTTFWITYESSPMQAYRMECTLYHKYQPVDNTIHPHVPAGALWRCPVEGCPWH
jgi:hypothetical protein